MNDPAKWQEENGRWLAAALAWLRMRLLRQAQRASLPQPAPAVEFVAKPTAGAPAEPSLLNRFFGRNADHPMSPPPNAGLLPPASETISAEQIAQAAQAMEDAEQIDPPPALHILAQRFDLSRFEREVLWLCAALELDTGIAQLCNLAQGNQGRAYPTFALALSLFDEPVWEALSPERPLRYWRLLEINQPGAQPLTTSALRADERIVNFIKGLNYLDDRLAALLTPLPAPLASDLASLPAAQRQTVAVIVQRLEQTQRAQALPVVQLLGADAASKHQVAAQVARALGLHPYRLPVEWLPSGAAELETLARFLNRESILSPVAFYLDAADGAEPVAEQQQLAALHRFLNRANGLFLLDTRDVRSGLGRAALAFDIQKPTPLEQREAWTQALGAGVDEKDDDSPALLAGQFNLSLSEIKQVAAAQFERDDARTPHEQLWDACLALTRPRLDTLAQRLDAKAKWDDLVLPPRETELLRQIAAQVSHRAQVYGDGGFAEKMNRGLGINALFAGDSGTGKTMAAEVIANALRLQLYRIDLSAVVSKYIGETEKNLRKLFDAAEDGGALLFFDEADALFGKRSEVKDSHDRYANIEINYLLQRIEAYRGLAILATNMKSALDTAFTRRLRFIVNFPFPGATERRDIWRKVFPPQTPTRGLDFDRLARLNLTGGNIHNVALNAAFLAAQARQPVTMPLVFAAARAEFGKLEHPVSEADFVWHEPAANKLPNELKEAA